MIRYNNLNVIYLDDVNAYKILYKNDIDEYLKDNNMDQNDFNNIDDCTYYFINNDLEMLKDYLHGFDLSNYDKIIVIAKLGLWRGVLSGKATYNNLYDAVINNMQDINIVYFKNNNTTLELSAAHHDGVNHFKFYKVVNGKKCAIKLKDLFIY